MGYWTLTLMPGVISVQPNVAIPDKTPLRNFLVPLQTLERMTGLWVKFEVDNFAYTAS